jgi:hypothetical protein
LAGFLDLVVDCGVFLIAGWRVAGPVRLPWGRPGPGRLVFAALVIHRQLLAEATKTPADPTGGEQSPDQLVQQ